MPITKGYFSGTVYGPSGNRAPGPGIYGNPVENFEQASINLIDFFRLPHPLSAVKVIHFLLLVGKQPVFGGVKLLLIHLVVAVTRRRFFFPTLRPDYSKSTAIKGCIIWSFWGNFFLEVKSSKLVLWALQKQNVVSQVEPKIETIRDTRSCKKVSQKAGWQNSHPYFGRYRGLGFVEDTQSLSHTQPGLIERRLNENFLNYNLLLTLETQIHTHTQSHKPCVKTTSRTVSLLHFFPPFWVPKG